ncbi:hypothetical protein GJAV_G00145100 [Gymnothorax javanicus]|nr:hypothetical protein GJAV_G00145100 [Gymnothorax javanicus]
MYQGFVLLLLCHLSSYASVTARKVCGRPPLGLNVEDANFQRVYDPGQELFLNCKPGYTPISGPRKIVCADTGTWSSSSFKCDLKSCSNPGPLINGKIHIADIVFQSIINFTCAEGYVLRGANTSECMHDGSWSHPVPQCDPVACGLPEIPKYASINYSRRFKGNTTFFGDSVTYGCSPPLVLLGNKVGFCLPNGTWSEPPECRVVTCPRPTEIPNGFISFAVIREHGYKERIRYGCDANYVLEGSMEVECGETGQWSKKPVCRAPCTVNIKRGRIFYNNKKIWIEDLKPNRVLHGDLLALYCEDKVKDCGYPVTTQCIDGTLKIPDCFEEPGAFNYKVRSSSLPSENLCK